MLEKVKHKTTQFTAPLPDDGVKFLSREAGSLNQNRFNLKSPYNLKELFCINLKSLICFIFLLNFTSSLFVMPQKLLYVSLFHNLMVLSFSRAADAMIFSVGWQAVQRTVSVCPCRR